MAVRVALGGRGLFARQAPASFPITQTPIRSTGGWYHRVTAWYGTIPVPAPGPPIVMECPPGPTAGHTAATGRSLYPALSVVLPALPRSAPWAGMIPHGVPGVTYTPAGTNPPQDVTVKPQLRVRTGGNRARVTTAPKPLFRWTRQGG
jgi:hypothetical protein